MNVDGVWMLFEDSKGRLAIVIEDEESVAGAIDEGAQRLRKGGRLPLVCTLIPSSFRRLQKEEWQWRCVDSGRPLEIATCVGIIGVEMQS